MSEYLNDFDEDEGDYFEDDEEELSEELKSQYEYHHHGGGGEEKKFEKNSASSTYFDSIVRKKGGKKKKKKRAPKPINTQERSKKILMVTPPPPSKTSTQFENEIITWVDFSIDCFKLDKLFFESVEAGEFKVSGSKDVHVPNLRKVRSATTVSRNTLFIHGGINEGKTTSEELLKLDVNTWAFSDVNYHFLRKECKTKTKMPVLYGHHCHAYSKADSDLLFYSGGSRVWMLRNAHEVEEKVRMKKMTWKGYDVKNYTEDDGQVVQVEQFTTHKWGERVYVFFGREEHTRNRRAVNQIFAITPVANTVDYYQDVREGPWRRRTVRRVYVDFDRIKKSGGEIDHFIKKLIVPNCLREEVPPPRYGHATVELYGKVYIYGGMGESNILNDLWAFDLEKWTFSKIEHVHGLPPPGLFHHAMFQNRKHLFVHGGYETKERVPTARMYKFDLDKCQWVAVVPTNMSNVFPIAEHSILSINATRALIVGGFTVKGEMNDVIVHLKGITDTEKEIEIMKYIDSKRRMKTEDYSDFRFFFPKEEEKELAAHKCILCRCSELRTVLLDHKELASIEVKDFEYDLVKAFLKFLYLGRLVLNSKKEMDEFLKLCHEWAPNFLPIVNDVMNRRVNLSMSHKLVEFLKEDLKSLYEKETFSDLRIICKHGDATFQAHKLIMTRSEFIRKCLNAGMMETIESKLVFETLSKRGLEQVLNYLYTDEIIGINNETCVEVHVFAIIFKLPIIASFCRNLILELLSEDTCLDMLELFDLYQDKIITSRCIRIIVDNFVELRNQEQFLNLSEEMKTNINLSYQRKRDRDLKKKLKQRF